jgi:hypothetical protein
LSGVTISRKKRFSDKSSDLTKKEQMRKSCEMKEELKQQKTILRNFLEEKHGN